jgi:hypothetical protein
VIVQVKVLWAYMSARWTLACRGDEGSIVEKVILTALFAAAAIAIGMIIVAKLTAKANSINLN